MQPQRWVASTLDAILGLRGRGGPVPIGIAAVGLFASSVCAQGAGNVLGRVSRADDAAGLPSALVWVSGTEIMVLSGDAGWYFLAGVPPGRHEIIVRLPSFAETRDTVEVTDGGAVVVDFQLELAPMAVEGVVVTAQPRPLQGLARRTVIGHEEIARRQATTLPQLLQGLVPGMTQTMTSGDVGSAGRIRIRGVRSLRGSPPLVFLDGVRVGSSRTAGPSGTGGILTFLGNINPRDLDRIEILHASEATTLFGTDGVGGAILLYTKR